MNIEKINAELSKLIGATKYGFTHECYYPIANHEELIYSFCVLRGSKNIELEKDLTGAARRITEYICGYVDFATQISFLTKMFRYGKITDTAEFLVHGLRENDKIFAGILSVTAEGMSWRELK